MPAKRPLRLPPTDVDARRIPASSYRTRKLWRLHETGVDALSYSLHPGHRFSHPDCPFAVLYLAESLATCLWERFGDEILQPPTAISHSLWMSRTASEIQAPPLRLCDFVSTRTRSLAKVDLPALNHTDLSIPQSWGLAIQKHPADFDGLRYPSRFNNKPCLALFDRPGLRSRFKIAGAEAISAHPAADAFLHTHQIALV